MAIKVGINGFGRIGRNVFRASLKDPNLEFVAVNDLTDPKTLAHLLKYDPILGNLPNQISAGGDSITESMARRSRFSPKRIPPRCVGIRGRPGGRRIHRPLHRRRRSQQTPARNGQEGHHLGPGQERRHHHRNGREPRQVRRRQAHIISNASCTTNCLAPMAKVINDNFKIVSGTMTTIHSYTNDQVILDFPHKDLRRARAAALSMIPTTTGAAKALKLVIPELGGKLDGFSMRVPTPNVSVVDLVVWVEKKTTKEEVNAALKKASEADR